MNNPAHYTPLYTNNNIVTTARSRRRTRLRGEKVRYILEYYLFYLHAAVDAGLDAHARLGVVYWPPPLMDVPLAATKGIAKRTAAALPVPAMRLELGAFLQFFQLGPELCFFSFLFVGFPPFELGIKAFGGPPFFRRKGVLFYLEPEEEHHVVPC